MLGRVGGRAALGVVCAAFFGLQAPAQAAPIMVTGELTSQPIGHYEFCQLYAGECGQLPIHDDPVVLTRELWQHILNINSAVNMVIEPRSDLEIYGKEEVWTFPDVAGDCEDYVLLKRQMLIDEGFPPAALLITVARRPDGEGHAVLTVRTDRGDLVLDNLRSEVRMWVDTEYTYLKRQSERHAGLWVTIETTDPIVVGTVD
ncbi:MAG: transglutaminase-like cysteine peptidase [Pseudomonadota bacterium]